MKKLLFSSLLLSISFAALSQKNDSTYYEAAPPLVGYLKPISVEFGKYYYGNKKLSSSGGGYSLEIPFSQLDDPQVNRDFKAFKTLRTTGQAISSLSLIYFLYSLNRRNYNQKEYLTVLGLSIGGSIVCNILSDLRLKKAILNYNLKLERNKLGFSIQPLPNQSFAFGIGFSSSF